MDIRNNTWSGELRIDILFGSDHRQWLDVEDQYHLFEQPWCRDAEYHHRRCLFQGAFEQGQCFGIGLIGSGLVAIDGLAK